MKAALKRLVRAVLSPLLGWLSARLDVLRERLDVLLAGQAELERLNRRALQERDAGLDALSRSLGTQGATLEAVHAEQVRLAGELRALRDEVRELAASHDHAEP